MVGRRARKQQARALPGHAPFCGVRRHRGPAYSQAPPTFRPRPPALVSSGAAPEAISRLRFLLVWGIASFHAGSLGLAAVSRCGFSVRFSHHSSRRKKKGFPPACSVTAFRRAERKSTVAWKYTSTVSPFLRL